MKKFEGILLLTDLDGTLLRDDKSVSKENLDAIEYFKENGGLFTIVTGRPSVIVGEIYDKVHPNAPIGCYNGGGIYDVEKKEYLWKKELSRDALELVRFIDREMEDMSIQICGFENCYFSKMNESMENHLVSGGFPDIRIHYEDVKEPLAKVLFAHTDEERLFRLRDLLFEHPEADKYDFIRSFQEYYEILPKGISKGNLVLKLAELLGIDKRRTIGVGDNDNDVSMIESAGVGIAVSNASPAALKAADIVTVSNEESAIAQIIKDIDDGKIRFKG